MNRPLLWTSCIHPRIDALQMKFLIPNLAAGSIIGKGGAHISEMQAQSQARMQVRSGMRCIGGDERLGLGAMWMGPSALVGGFRPARAWTFRSMGLAADRRKLTPAR